MGLAGQSIEPITEDAIDSLDVDGTRFGNNLAQGGINLDREQFSMLVSMLDGLRQAHISRHDQRGASALARTDWLAICSSEDRYIAPPAIATPRQRTTLRARNREGHRSFDKAVADA